MRQTSSRWWADTRAALARLFGRVEVRDAPPEAWPEAPLLHRSQATLWPSGGKGEWEERWQASAVLRIWQPPSVSLGEGGNDKAVIPCVVNRGSIPELAPGGVRQSSLLSTPPPVRKMDAGRGTSWTTTVRMLPVTPAGGTVQLSVIAWQPPAVRTAAVVPLLTRQGGKRDPRGGIPPFRTLRTQSDLASVLRMPLQRQRAAWPSDIDLAVAFAAERRALATAGNVSIENVRLLAAFPRVPLALVRQMALSEDGETLRLWLRTDARAALPVTIVLGRNRTTGEMLRAVLPETVSKMRTK